MTGTPDLTGYLLVDGVSPPAMTGVPGRPGLAWFLLVDGAIPDRIGPRTDWEHAVSSWCAGRAALDAAEGRNRRPLHEIQADALRRLDGPLRAARLGHVTDFTGRLPSRASRWRCARCPAWLETGLGWSDGPALTLTCPGKNPR